MLIFLTSGFSQYVRMGVSSVKASSPEAQQQIEATMKSMKIESFATPDKVRSDVNMMGGMVVMSTFTNPNDDSFVMYMDMMGQKMKVVPTPEELKSIKEEGDNNSKDMKITEVPGDSKTILGFKCKKINVSNGDMNVVMYVTPDLKMKANRIQGMEGLKIDGYPLEYTVEAAGTKMTFTADKYEPTFDDGKMKEPSGKYKEMTFTEFKKQMPGM
ncbi:MAG TPA: DUF4412 domain-containing protein [Saprospiraceae bacterium]|nr:MAG: hypothetical protein UZ08_BCD001000191 [Candidatus Parvibacillus calidus]MBX2936550.1 DUF4412 domain-containing protein [Saprospiraceae bacterium]MBK7739361.1 DUF4412 domain-containing protein [Candidatus Parvibacillus calidus]MBX7178618.1 DUF4412 domain-containing protein [Saprospiraceae bacterium]MCB0590044.1 DUF4412 domain-containing protein [Saprospiraceae bacterium]